MGHVDQLRRQLKLVQSVIDEVPQFVHRTGNTARSLADRLIEPMPMFFITKPILHLTADRPLAADVQVFIASGRPWVRLSAGPRFFAVVCGYLANWARL